MKYIRKGFVLQTDELIQFFFLSKFVSAKQKANCKSKGSVGFWELNITKLLNSKTYLYPIKLWQII